MYRSLSKSLPFGFIQLLKVSWMEGPIYLHVSSSIPILMLIIDTMHPPVYQTGHWLLPGANVIAQRGPESWDRQHPLLQHSEPDI